jgi:hypothetical protein
MTPRLGYLHFSNSSQLAPDAPKPSRWSRARSSEAAPKTEGGRLRVGVGKI